MELMDNKNIYDDLTSHTTDDKLNFLESLSFNDNSKLLIKNLNKLQNDNYNFKIIKGFISDKIEKDSTYNSFENCLIETTKDLNNYDFTKKIDDNHFLVSAK